MGLIPNKVSLIRRRYCPAADAPAEPGDGCFGAAAAGEATAATCDPGFF
jgi:hypothetical protein